MNQPARSALFIGLMSGTSLDGVDGVLARIDPDAVTTVGAAHVPFDDSLRDELMALQSSGDNEIEREALAANKLAVLYAQCVSKLLARCDVPADQIHALGVHGQTIRHCPERGFTRQTNNPALLAELTGIDVVADFRSRDVAAGGQGAPLVPAFHQAVFGNLPVPSVIVNIGGIANVTVFHPIGAPASAPANAMIGFDTGPGNVLMDLWTRRHLDQDYDRNGDWAATGTVVPALLEALLAEPYLALPPPKSTGRDLFHANWLQSKLRDFSTALPVDVQATLTRFTATSIADAIKRYAPLTEAVYVCGGGAFNRQLLQEIRTALAGQNRQVKVGTTGALGISPSEVEALAFAWLASRFSRREPGNLPAVTGASGLRILGALYPA